jgi:hypothetical protein
MRGLDIGAASALGLEIGALARDGAWIDDARSDAARAFLSAFSRFIKDDVMVKASESVAARCGFGWFD